MSGFKKRYASCMKEFLLYIGHVHCIDEIKRRDLPQYVLLSIRPSMIVEYFYMKASGTSSPDDDSRPTQARSSALHIYKKAFFGFMLNQNS